MQASLSLSSSSTSPPEERPKVVAEVHPLSEDSDYSSEGEAVPIANFHEHSFPDVSHPESSSAVMEPESTSHLVEQPEGRSEEYCCFLV